MPIVAASCLAEALGATRVTLDARLPRVPGLECPVEVLAGTP